jgi:formylglycine-generating enzyme required for sulfatase activity
MGSPVEAEPEPGLWPTLTRAAVLSDRERPCHEVTLGAFSISRHPITAGQFRAYLTDTNRSDPIVHPPGQGPQPSDLPAAFVPWHEAIAFCAWLTGRAGVPFRLPTEAEWERAARGTDGRPYPWGWETPSPRLCNFGGMLGGPQPVSACAAGASPVGCLNMAGNVWEWCADWFDPRYYEVSPDQDPAGPAHGRNRVIRGGCWESAADLVRCAARLYDRPYGPTFYPCGFRVVTTAMPPPTPA